MKACTIAFAVAVLSVSPVMAAFAPPLQFSPLSRWKVSPSTIIRVDVALEGQQKKPKRKSKKKKSSDAATEEGGGWFSAFRTSVATPEHVLESAAPLMVEQESLEIEKALRIQQEAKEQAVQLEREWAEQEKRQREAEERQLDRMKAKRKQEVQQRAILIDRLDRQVRERQERRAREAELAAIAAKQRLEAQLKLEAMQKLEAKQRAILMDRLDREERVRQVHRAREAEIAAKIAAREAQIEAKKAAIADARRQPKSPQVEKQLKEKYAAILDLGERAFAILMDLGMVEVSPDPSDPEYDSTHDNEFVMN